MARDLTPDAISILETLVGFDTTSHLSNLKLIEWVEGYLDGHGEGREYRNVDQYIAELHPAIPQRWFGVEFEAALPEQYPTAAP